MYNHKKIASKNESYAEQLIRRNKALGLTQEGDESTDKKLDRLRDNKEIIDTTEVQLGSDRDNADDLLTQKKLEASGQHNDRNENLSVKPMDVLNQAQEKERLKAYKAAESIDDTAYWDEYVGKVTKDAPSQLANNAGRFTGLSTDVNELSRKGKVRDMVTASLRDADLMLFNVYFKAASQDRNLTADERSLVEKLTADKVRVLAGVGDASVKRAFSNPSEVASRIEKLQHLMTKEMQANGHTDDFDRMNGELSQLIEHGRQLVQGQPQQGAMVQPFQR